MKDKLIEKEKKRQIRENPKRIKKEKLSRKPEGNALKKKKITKRKLLQEFNTASSDEDSNSDIDYLQICDDNSDETKKNV